MLFPAVVIVLAEVAAPRALVSAHQRRRVEEAGCSGTHLGSSLGSSEAMRPWGSFWAL